MRPLKSLISIEEAQSIINANISPIATTEEVLLKNLIGRIAAEDIVSDVNIPPFRRAAMDGYAVKAESTFSATESTPIFLTCIEEVHAGEVPQKIIREEECTEIATGAMIPESADTVVQVEYTNKSENEIEIFKAFAPGTNVSNAGADVNTANDSGDSALMTAAGHPDQEGAEQIMELLLESAADVNWQNQTGSSALMYAAQTGSATSIRTARLLLQAGADPNLASKEAESAIEFATKHEISGMLNLLNNDTLPLSLASKTSSTLFTALAAPAATTPVFPRRLIATNFPQSDFLAGQTTLISPINLSAKSLKSCAPGELSFPNSLRTDSRA